MPGYSIQATELASTRSLYNNSPWTHTEKFLLYGRGYTERKIGVSEKVIKAYKNWEKLIALLSIAVVDIPSCEELVLYNIFEYFQTSAYYGL